MNNYDGGSDYDHMNASGNEGSTDFYSIQGGGEDAFSRHSMPQAGNFQGGFPQTRWQTLQPPQAHHASTQDARFTAWNGQGSMHLPVPSHSTAGDIPLHFLRQSISDSTLSTPTQASYHTPNSLNRMIHSNVASSSNHKMKKQRIHPPFDATKDASAHNSTRQMLQSSSSIGQIELPYRSIWKMKQFNSMQSEMLTELLQGDENVVVTAPTGAGKTVLFEMALIRMFQKNKDGKAVYLAPTKALCSEKFRDWNYRLKSMNCKVLEMTGDSKITTPEEVKAARLIIATPEKWDFITRRAERSDPLMSKLKLFLIDEVHSVREKVRGALLEVLIARTKSRDPDTRIIAVSATIPNADDVAQWIGSRQRSARDKPETRELAPFVFSDEFRPCPLQKEIYGFKPKTLTGNYYDFERELTKELPSIIEEHSKGKATLIFCSSRSGTQQVATSLSECCQQRFEQNLDTPWPNVPETNGLSFSNEDLQKLSSYGIAFHHAGLDQSDKLKVEAAFIKGQIKILCATTTLAVGVNLPAYLVIIRGTKLNTGVFEEHSDLTILQMMGRAGRPQFDKEGICVIMTEQDRREHYEQLLKGQNIIESTLHLNLIEHINAEICARGRCRAYNIEKWLKETFLFVRMSKNWTHYSIENCSDQNTPEENVRNITRNTLETLSKVDLIENYNSTKSDQDFNSTEYGRTMSNYSLRFRTMIELKNLHQGASMRDLISTISQAQEFSDLFIRAGEKVMYSNILREIKLRFPPARVESLCDKVSVLLQLSLTGFKIKEIMENEARNYAANANNEQLQIMKTAPKIARAMMNIAIFRKDGAFLFEAFKLSRSLNGKSWDDEAATLTQLDGVGSGTMQFLSQQNIKSIKALAKASPAELAMMICKSPAQASKLINDAKKIPQIHLDVREVDVQQKQDGSVESTIRITIALAHNQAELKKLRLQTREGKAFSIGTIIFSTNTDAKECQLRRAGIWNFTENGQSLEVKCRFLTASDEIVMVCAAEDISGSSVTRKLKTSFPADRFPLKNAFVPGKSLLGTLRANETDMQDLPIASTSAVARDGEQRGSKLKQNGKIPPPAIIKDTGISRKTTKTTVDTSKKDVHYKQSVKPVNEEEKDMSTSESQNIKQSETSLSEDKGESFSLEADGVEIVVVKKRKYTRKLPTVKQMAAEYEMIKAEWIKMKAEKGEPVQENEEYAAFKAIKQEDAKTRTKRHYKRKYPPPAMMKAELEEMKDALQKFRGNLEQPSEGKVEANAGNSSLDKIEAEGSDAAKVNIENSMVSRVISKESSSIKKVKGKTIYYGRQAEPSKSFKKGKEKETSNYEDGRAAVTEAGQIPKLAMQLVQPSIEILPIPLASGSRIEHDSGSENSEGEVEALLPDEEEHCSGIGSDNESGNLDFFSDNDNDLFTDNLLDDDLVAFCNINEMRELQDVEIENVFC